MVKKQAKMEIYTRGLMRYYTGDKWVKKNTDMAKFMGALTSKEEGVDYNICLVGIQIECKNTQKATGTLVDRISDVQRDLLDKYGGYIALGMWDIGYPALPKGADGYLIPWEIWKERWPMLDIPYKSIRRVSGPRSVGVIDIFPEFLLPYAPGGWYIPKNHPIWADIITRCKKTLEAIDVYDPGIPVKSRRSVQKG